MTAEQIIFLLTAVLVLGSALMVVTVRNLLHAALWLPLILLVTLLPLRMVKGLLIALQYHHKAAPGRLVSRDDAPKGGA